MERILIAKEEEEGILGREQLKQRHQNVTIESSIGRW